MNATIAVGWVLMWLMGISAVITIIYGLVTLRERCEEALERQRTIQRALDEYYERRR